jgi:hypothetical protein
VILTVRPAGSPSPSVTCTASIPGVAAPGGICTTAGQVRAHYAMFQSHNAVIEISVHANHPATNGQLEQLARLAFGHTT